MPGAAMSLYNGLCHITQHSAARVEVAEMLRRLDLKMLLSFTDNPNGKRPKRVVQGGRIVFGLGDDVSDGDNGNGDHPLDADDGDGGKEPPIVGNGMPITQMRQQEGASFSKHMGGKPPMAPNSLSKEGRQGTTE